MPPKGNMPLLAVALENLHIYLLTISSLIGICMIAITAMAMIGDLLARNIESNSNNYHKSNNHGLSAAATCSSTSKTSNHKLLKPPCKFKRPNSPWDYPSANTSEVMFRCKKIEPFSDCNKPKQSCDPNKPNLSCECNSPKQPCECNKGHTTQLTEPQYYNKHRFVQNKKTSFRFKKPVGGFRLTKAPLRSRALRRTSSCCEDPLTLSQKQEHDDETLFQEQECVDEKCPEIFDVPTSDINQKAEEYLKKAVGLLIAEKIETLVDSAFQNSGMMNTIEEKQDECSNPTTRKSILCNQSKAENQKHVTNSIILGKFIEKFLSQKIDDKYKFSEENDNYLHACKSQAHIAVGCEREQKCQNYSCQQYQAMGHDNGCQTAHPACEYSQPSDQASQYSSFINNSRKRASLPQSYGYLRSGKNIKNQMYDDDESTITQLMPDEDLRTVAGISNIGTDSLNGSHEHKKREMDLSLYQHLKMWMSSCLKTQDENSKTKTSTKPIIHRKTDLKRKK